MTGLQDQATAVRPGEELDLVKLEPFLRSHFPNETGALAVRQFPSGHSNLTYSVHLGQREMVLRRPPFGSKVKSAHDMGREFRVLSKLHAAYPPAPKVLFICDDESVLGAPFYVMEPIRGIILRRDPPPGMQLSAETVRRLCESFIGNLAILHGLDAAALIHNDYKYDNVVLDPKDITRIIGVLDWEMCTIGDPLTDLGSALAYWVDRDDPEDMQRTRWGPTTYPGSMTRAELVHLYAQKTGRDVSNILFYLVFARFKIAVIIQQIYYRYHQGLTKDERFASMPELIKLLLRASWRSAETGAI